MSIVKGLKSEDGFTIQELLVAIIAGSMLVGFSFSLYLFVARIVQKDMHAREHKQRAQEAVELITSDIERSSLVIQLNDSTLELGSAMHGHILYTWREGVLSRRSVALGPGKGERWSFRCNGLPHGVIGLRLKSSWGADSVESHAEVHVPWSSTVKFTM